MNPSLFDAQTLGRVMRRLGGTNAWDVRKRESSGQTSRRKNHIAATRNASRRLLLTWMHIANRDT
jgi:hypothetical protein